MGTRTNSDDRAKHTDSKRFSHSRVDGSRRSEATGGPHRNIGNPADYTPEDGPAARGLSLSSDEGGLAS